MKARWEFYFDCTGIRFERVHKFEATIAPAHAKAFGLPEAGFDALISLEPDKDNESPHVEQTGKLKITLPGNNEETKRLAFWLARKTTEQITFSQGEMKLAYGLIGGEHLPETEDEAQRLGDKPCFYEVHLVEARPTPTFDGSSLERVASDPLIEHFNAAIRSENPIDRFLGLFKILEDLYHPVSKKVSLAKAMKASTELFQIAREHVQITTNGNKTDLTKIDFVQLINKLVRTRDQCAHLRRAKGHGITHGDPRERAEVEPLANLLRKLTYDAIKRRL